jgi:RNA ligase (TIGR02306 family)
MERKLASIRKIKEILPHNNADALELAIVDGWQVVVRKGEFTSGELVCYFEIDSWIPNEIAPFLSKGKSPRIFQGVVGERLRTAKLRNELSQGLILPLSNLNSYRLFDSHELGREVWNDEYKTYTQCIVPIEEGVDLTELLEIKKYEQPIPTELAGKIAGNFPSSIPKTDLMRIQNFFDDIQAMDYKGGWVVEEKMNGSSCTIYTHFKTDVAEGYYEMGICSRNFELKIEGNETNAFIMTATREGWFEHLPKLSSSMAIQAELCGPGIQGNPYNLSECKLFVFDIWSISSGRYATHEERMSILDELDELGVKVNTVPHLNSILKLPSTVKELLEMAEAKSVINENYEREGIVLKTHKLYNDHIVSFKVISNKHLLKEK